MPWNLRKILGSKGTCINFLLAIWIGIFLFKQFQWKWMKNWDIPRNCDSKVYFLIKTLFFLKQYITMATKTWHCTTGETCHCNFSIQSGSKEETGTGTLIVGQVLEGYKSNSIQCTHAAGFLRQGQLAFLVETGGDLGPAYLGLAYWDSHSDTVLPVHWGILPYLLESIMPMVGALQIYSGSSEANHKS